MYPIYAAILAAAGVLLSTSPATAQQQFDNTSIEHLLKALEQRDRDLARRDAEIGALYERMAELERRVDAQEREQIIPASTAKIASGLVGPRHDQTAQRPGEVIVDEEAAERALERTLAIEGALLIPTGGIEIEPNFSYSRRENDAPIVVGAQIANNELRRNEFEARANVRLGLPFDSQFEVGLPYQFVDQSRVTSVGATAVQDQDGHGSGIGDIALGFAKTLFRERGALPDVIGRITWDTDTGDLTDSGVALLGNSFHEVRGSLTAVKRQDPLVFVGNVSYQKAFEANNTTPGDQVGIGFSTFLAASPDTSLRFSLDQNFIQKIESNGQEIDGSDGVISSLTIGASTILAPGVLLDGSASVGLTNDGPDYSIRLAIPIRFNSGL